MKKIYFSIILIVAGTAAVLFISGQKLPPIDSSGSSSSPTPSQSVFPSAELIRVENVVSDQLIESPLFIKGEARGYWFFEASFPIRIYDADGLELGVVVAQAKSEWMTEDFVPFEANLVFKKPVTATGVLVLRKDNPSGLPEHDDELRVNVRFDLDNWPVSTELSQCKTTGCSGQICSDEDVVTTCEFKQEYACYQNAKCERQSDGKCGWTPSEELVACLYSAWGASTE
ncbi:MAG: hypothetical protein A3F98_03985 [Candidatus Yanofskybacteria bacterium RIFCSPLOWO2_12_FULL_41_8]|nr:MAG: hypothetical protein A3F98_03985 [Candidatus Yanofskybacteria bacterium RIFCSPLOWO2_12_FULL_41_8]